MNYNKSLMLFLALAVISIQGWAQEGELSGYTRDAQSGEPLVGVLIKLQDTEFGAASDLNGFYTIQNIPPKTYNVEASYLGYERSVVYNVIVRSAGNPDLNFNLKESVTELENVVVTANPFESSEETPLSVNRLSREEIATYPGGNNDIAKVAQSLPGVGASVGGFRNDIIIRGGAPNENVYYLDGIEVPTINHFSTQGSAGGPVGLLNVSFFEGVTLSSSSFSAFYDNPLSGVLQFDQRNGNTRDFRGNVRVSSSEAALTLEGPVLKKDKDASNTTFLASVRRSYLQLLFKALDLPFLPDYWDGQLKINHKIDAYNEIDIIGLGSIDDFAVNVPSDINDEQQATLEQVPVIKQWTLTTGATWKRRFRDGSGYMRTSLSTNVFNNDFRQYQDNVNETGLLLQNNGQEWENKLNYDITKFKGEWVITAGAKLQQVNYDTETIDRVNNAIFRSDISFIRYGLFAQASRNYLDGRLSTTLGVRFDGNTFTDQGNNLLRTFSPRASLSYALDEEQRWKLNASLGRYYKIPIYTVLGFKDNMGNLVNKDADYTRSDHAVIGVEYLPTPSLKITLESFYKRYSNYAVSVNDSVSLANLGGGFEVLGNERVETVGNGRSYGIEFSVQQKFTKNVYAIFAYTLFKSEFTGFDEDSYLPSLWDSRHLLTFTGGYKLPRNWEISTRIRFIGKTPYPPVNEEASTESYPILIFNYDELGQERLDPFTQVDLRIDKKWNFRKVAFNVFFEVENLLGQQNPSPPQYGLARDQEGNILEPRQLQEIEEIDSGQILPTIGLVLDF